MIKRELSFGAKKLGHTYTALEGEKEGYFVEWVIRSQEQQKQARLEKKLALWKNV